MPAKGREPRTQSIATRFTRTEELELLDRAEAAGMNLREWARDVLLHAESEGLKSEMEMQIFAELIGIQMLLMGALEPLLKNLNMPAEQVDQLFRQVQTTKTAKAQELLARRSQKQEK
jgi:ribosomal protein L16 Arg81 hydroxylase